MAKRKLALRKGVRVRAYEVVCRAVEEGVAYGWNRGHKHTSTPDQGALKSEIEDGVMGTLCEVLEFHEELG